jgi:hypothetical protein
MVERRPKTLDDLREVYGVGARRPPISAMRSSTRSARSVGLTERLSRARGER